MTTMPPAPIMNEQVIHPWLPDNQHAVNADFSKRVVLLPGANPWQSTGFDGLQIRIFEYLPGEHFRLTAQLRAVSGGLRSSLQLHSGMEVLVQAGELSDQDSVYPAGIYLRDPASNTRSDTLQTLHFGTAEDEATSISPGLIFLSLGQFEQSDTEERVINTYDENKWLPGPIEGTEVMPLHLHGTSNSMLVRWTTAATFTPRLDPHGEEVLVTRGTLCDDEGHYPAGTWIRNPVETWQPWSAEAGTVIYYKNGHFPDAQT